MIKKPETVIITICISKIPKPTMAIELFFPFDICVLQYTHIIDDVM